MIPGIHVSTAGGIDKAPERLRELDLNAGQIFTASQRRWESPPISKERLSRFRERSLGLTFVSHASYLINLASSRTDVLERSRAALARELERCTLLGIPSVVMHPGAHQGAGVDQGVEMVASALYDILAVSGNGPMLLLENTAGAGTTLGSSFEELSAIRELSRVPERIGYCIDTAHAHGAGYRVDGKGFPEEIRRILGSGVKAFHLNGSKVSRGSRRDRHEHFDRGNLTLSDMKALFSSPFFKGVPGIAETPGTDADRARDIGMLYNGKD